MEKLNVLFLCTGNSCRSQMAEGWARALLSDRLNAFSAGVEPHGMNPYAVQVMREAGIDLGSHRSKHIDELKSVPLDFIVTVCDHANETCPVLPSKTRKIHRSFDDPPRLAKSATTDAERLPHYRRVRDEIKAFVETLPRLLELPA